MLFVIPQDIAGNIHDEFSLDYFKFFLQKRK